MKRRPSLWQMPRRVETSGDGKGSDLLKELNMGSEVWALMSSGKVKE